MMMNRRSRERSCSLFEHPLLSDLHKTIESKITELEGLNSEFKLKQERHFLKMFMSVLERMGNDLLLAQEAYHNIDIEIKRD